MKKKTLSVSLLLGAFLLLWQSSLALDLESAKSLYLSMLDGKHEFSQEVKKSIFEELPYYRFFKIYIVGSVERTETTKKTGDYLEPLFLTATKGDSEELILAKAIYLTWWEAKLNNRPHTVEIVKNSPIFNDFFNEYQMRVTEAFGNYAQDLAAYLLGANVEMPYVPQELNNIREKILDENFTYEPAYDGKEAQIISLLMTNPEIVKSIIENFKDVKAERHKFDSETLLLRTRAMIFRTAFSQIAGLKDEIAREFVKLSPKTVNILWIRWIVYLTVFLIGYFKLKNINIPITLLVAAETVYIGTVLNISSVGDGMLYGIITATAILFSIFYLTYKKKWIPALMTFAALLLLFVPQVALNNLLMTDSFSSSVFYQSLLQDILRDPLGKVQKSLRNYNTALNESIQNFSALLSELEIDEAKIERSLFEPANFEGRLKFVSQLKSKYKDKRNVLEDFLYFEKKRASKLKKELAKIRAVLVSAARISSQRLRQELLNFLESNFEGPDREVLKNTLESVETLKHITVSGFSIRNVLVSYILMYLAIFMIALGRSESFILIAGAFASAVTSLIGPQEFFVQSGVPTVLVNISYQIPICLILALLLGFYWFKENNFFRRREKA